MIQNTVLKETKMNIGGKSREKKKNMQEKRKKAEFFLSLFSVS
jgi:hypothetical protein